MGAFKLGKMTFGSLFKKPETIQYPFESKPQPAGLKGHVVIQAPDCILCGMCDRSCTTNCISVDKKARTWSINPYQCVQCSYCITVCPKDCLSMDPNYWTAAGQMEASTVLIPEQVKEEKPQAKATEVKTSDKPAVAVEKPASAPSAADGQPNDPQLDRLIELMDDEAAQKVRKALA